MSTAALVEALLARDIGRIEAATAALAAAGPAPGDAPLLDRAARLVRALERGVAGRHVALGGSRAPVYRVTG